jgi:hypothetical protein
MGVFVGTDASQNKRALKRLFETPLHDDATLRRLRRSIPQTREDSMQKLRRRLTFANVVSCIALFVALGGAAFAAGKLGKNTVGTKQIKNQAVTAAKIKKGTITGTNINLAKLGTVPSASNAATANTATTAATANALSPPEGIHMVGASGEPPFVGGSGDISSSEIKLPPVSFYKDHDGIVHLEGVMQVGKEEKFAGAVPIFTLPPGFRPANGVTQIFKAGSKESGVLVIGGTNANFGGHSISGGVFGTKEEVLVLSGVTYRAQS